MPNYYHDVSVARQKGYKRRLKILLTVLLAITMLVTVAIVLDILNQGIQTDTDIGKQKVTVVEDGLVNFNTKYYSFKAPKTWTLVESESNESSFVYRAKRGSLVEHELKIYVNYSDYDLSGTRVLPIVLVGNKIESVGSASQHCSTYSTQKKAQGPVNVVVDGISMSCQLDGTNYLVIIGNKENNDEIRYMSSKFGQINVSIVYRNSTTTPDTIQLTNILKTMQFY